MEFFKKSKGDGHEIIRMEILFLIPGFFVVIFIMNYSKLTTTQKVVFLITGTLYSILSIGGIMELTK